jgi:hypothetical protein
MQPYTHKVSVHVWHPHSREIKKKTQIQATKQRGKKQHIFNEAYLFIHTHESIHIQQLVSSGLPSHPEISYNQRPTKVLQSALFLSAQTIVHGGDRTPNLWRDDREAL